MPKKDVHVPDIVESPELKQAIHETAKSIVESISTANAPIEEVPHDPMSPIPNDDPDGAFMRVSRLNVPAPMKVQQGTTEISGRAALALAELKAKEREKQGIGPKHYVGKVSYIEHDIEGCGGPGIWIVGDPRHELTADKWFASYKAPGSAWPPNAQPYCQCCKMRTGEEAPLKGVNFISTNNPGPDQRHIGLVANQRYVRSITKEQYEALWNPQPASAGA